MTASFSLEDPLDRVNDYLRYGPHRAGLSRSTPKAGVSKADGAVAVKWEGATSPISYSVAQGGIRRCSRGTAASTYRTVNSLTQRA